MASSCGLEHSPYLGIGEFDLDLPCRPENVDHCVEQDHHPAGVQTPPTPVLARRSRNRFSRLPDLWAVEDRLNLQTVGQPAVEGRRRLAVGRPAHGLGLQSKLMSAAVLSSDRIPRATAAPSIRPVASNARRPAQALTELGLTSGSLRRPAASRIRRTAALADDCLLSADPVPRDTRSTSPRDSSAFRE